jgi:ribonuclease G
VRPELNIVTGEVCPTCNGTGKISASILVTDQVDAVIDDLLGRQNMRSLTLYVHPFLHSYYTKGLVSRQMRWYMKYYKWVKIMKDTSLGITDFKVMDEHGDEIELHSSAQELNGVQDKHVEVE